MKLQGHYKRVESSKKSNILMRSSCWRAAVHSLPLESHSETTFPSPAWYVVKTLGFLPVLGLKNTNAPCAIIRWPTTHTTRGLASVSSAISSMTAGFCPINGARARRRSWIGCHWFYLKNSYKEEGINLTHLTLTWQEMEAVFVSSLNNLSQAPPEAWCVTVPVPTHWGLSREPETGQSEQAQGCGILRI